MDYFVHEKAIIEANVTIGKATKVWAFAHILSGATLGSECNICDGVFIEGDVALGDRVTVKCGVQIWNGIRIGNDVFIGPNATFTNDRFPRSKKHLSSHPQTVLNDGCSIGANATILPGLIIGKNAMVGAGAVVTRSVPPNAVVTGNPAEIVGYENAKPSDYAEPTAENTQASKRISRVRGVTFHTLPLVQDIRGDLTVGNFPHEIPFLPKRYFMVFNVKSREIRGEHAHHKCEQFLICVSGQCRVVADDGLAREQFLLDSPTQGLYLPPMTWATQYKYSNDGVLLVFASDYYDPKDYIRNYDEFLRLIKR
jgi:UDP-2-acetamido-3-amino-2,3-dideoxy-glucuronate N-acetyltransferase